MKKRIVSASACVLLVGVCQVQAASIGVSEFSVGAYNTAVSSLTVDASENFESSDGFNLGGSSYYQPIVTDTAITSAVGSFESIGGTGSGRTITDVNDVNFDASKIAVRTGNVYGRSSTTDDISGNSGALQFLDSNDTMGIDWNVSLGGRSFDTLSFVIGDATDVGATLTITVDGISQYYSNLDPSNQQLVVISFDSLVSSSLVSFTNSTLNDGFSLDDIVVGRSSGGGTLAVPTSVVPLPAGGFLLLTAIGALAASKKRKKAA